MSDNDNMRRWKVSNMDGSNVRFIEALGFEVEKDSAGIIFYDVEDKLVARLFNVLVEPADTARESSDELVAIAQRYIDIQQADLFFDDKDERERVAADLRSLAGCVLAQAGTAS